MADITKINGYDIKDKTARVTINNIKNVVENNLTYMQSEIIKNEFNDYSTNSNQLRYIYVNEIYGNTRLGTDGKLQFECVDGVYGSTTYLLTDNVFNYAKEENGGISPLMMSIGNKRNYIAGAKGELHVLVKGDILSNYPIEKTTLYIPELDNSIDVYKVDCWHGSRGFMIDNYEIKPALIDLSEGSWDSDIQYGKVMYSDNDECLYFYDPTNDINIFKEHLRNTRFIYELVDDEEVHNIKSLIPSGTTVKLGSDKMLSLTVKTVSSDMDYPFNAPVKITKNFLNI